MKSFILLIIFTLITSSLQGGCKTNKWSGEIPEANIIKMLNDNNKKRQTLANGNETGLDGKKFPQSSNMSKMFWNKELAKKAQGWADQLVKDCAFEHNPDRKFEGSSTGENLYYGATSKVLTTDNMENAFIKANDNWWNEKKDYDTTKISPFVFSGKTGHFTQMAWATSIEIGCGYALYEDDRSPSNELVVCNYIPAGNFLNKPLYKTGNPCSECEAGKTCSTEFSGLCGKNGYYLNDNAQSNTQTNNDSTTTNNDSNTKTETDKSKTINNTNNANNQTKVALPCDSDKLQNENENTIPCIPSKLLTSEKLKFSMILFILFPLLL